LLGSEWVILWAIILGHSRGTWKVRSLYRVGSLKTVSRELARYTFDLVGVQEVRWEDGGTEPAGEYTFFMERGMRIAI
jgi:hypothetical protein